MKFVPFLPDFTRERALSEQGFTCIAGIDEVGRGPLAGPIVAAAVVIDPYNIPFGLNDSKKLSAEQREKLFHEIMVSSQVGIASVAARTIDRINILQATFKAMRLALNALPKKAEYVLIDGKDVPKNLPCEAQAIIKGDMLCISISAASIVAKVTRDAMMIQAETDYEGYSFLNNKGYGSMAHMSGINELGSCPLHRLSFAPFSKNVIKRN